uniref:Uncharacterized protein n=1 Tax=Arundo donax TaxID=35708 RepID=A0A0A9AI94_ARUDO
MDLGSILTEFLLIEHGRFFNYRLAAVSEIFR